MKRILFLITFIMLITLNGCAQRKEMNLEDINEIWLYDYFNSKGYTQGEVYRKFQELENNKTAKIQLDSVFVDSIKCTLIQSAKCKKLLPGKCGQNLIFVQFVLKNNSIRNIIFGTNGVFDYFVGNMGYFLLDNPDRKNKVLWINDYYSKLMDKINHNSDLNNKTGQIIQER